MTNRLLPQSQDRAGRRGSQGMAPGPAATHCKARRGARGQPQPLPAPAPCSPQPTSPKPSPAQDTVTQPPAHARVYTCRITSRVSQTHGTGAHKRPLNVTPTFTHSRTHTPTQQLRLHRHPHQHSPGLSPTQTEGLGDTSTLTSPGLGLLLSPPQQGRKPTLVRGHAGQARGQRGREMEGEGDNGRHGVSQSSRAGLGTGRCPWWGEKTIHAMQDVGDTEPGPLEAEKGGRGCHSSLAASMGQPPNPPRSSGLEPPSPPPPAPCNLWRWLPLEVSPPPPPPTPGACPGA